MKTVIDELIEDMAQRFLYEGNTALYGSEKWQSKAISIAKEKINDSAFVIDENTPVEVKALLEDIKLLSAEPEEEIKEPEFEFIQGFPVVLNNEHKQIQANELKAEIKPPEGVTDNSKSYLSDEFEEKDFQSWTNEKHILLIANAGAGKTSLLLDKFTSWAEKQGKMKTVLYLYNRKVMKAQFADKKAEEHKNLTICSYQGIEESARGINVDVQTYIDSFDYILCDECHYFVSDAAFNENTFLSYEAVNNCKGTAIYFTATPKYFLRMKDKLNKPLKIIDKLDNTKKNVKKIYLARNKFDFDFCEEKLMKEQKIIHFENDSDNLKNSVERYLNKGYKSEMLVSEKNKNKKIMNKEVAEQIKHSSDENGNDIANVFTDFLGCTSAYENGVNFNVEGSVTVSFAKYINWTSLEQSRSRVRNFNNNSVNMLVCLPHKNFLKNIDFVEPELIDYLEYCNETTDKNAIFGRDEYNKYNDFRIAYHVIELEEVREILNADDKVEYYKEKLHELYPNAEICMANEMKSSFINFDEVMQSFIGYEIDEEYLFKYKQNELGELFKNLNFVTENANRKFGIERINRELERNGSIFRMETKNKRNKVNGKVENTWHVYKMAQ